jgi:hypothetical protein
MQVWTRASPSFIIIVVVVIIMSFFRGLWLILTAATVTHLQLISATRGEPSEVECDLLVRKRNICTPFSVYEWGLSRCLLISGEEVNFTCAVLENVNVSYISQVIFHSPPFFFQNNQV